MSERNLDAVCTGHDHADGVDLAGAQYSALRVGTGIAKTARGGLDPLAQLGPDQFRTTENVPGGALGHPSRHGYIRQRCHTLHAHSPIPSNPTQFFWTGPINP